MTSPTSPRPPLGLALPAGDGARDEIAARLGINVPAQWWPTAPMLKGFEAAGFRWVQVHTPPRGILCARRHAARHAAALRAMLETCGLQLVLHGPDDLSAGTPEHDRALDGLLEYAAATRARFVVYHGANFPIADGGRQAAVTRDRARAEEASLHQRLGRLESLGLTLGVENLAPVYPGPPRLCHSPAVVRGLVQRLDSPQVRMLLDVGHAHITGSAREALQSAAAEISLFHLHDNFGSSRPAIAAPALDPLRLDLHLAPGNGRVPWRQLAPLLVDHAAPLVLEVHPPHRPEPLSVAKVTTELLAGRATRVDGSRSAVADGASPSPVPLG
jgi:sugar phosphate isomerase/epimerase